MVTYTRLGSRDTAEAERELRWANKISMQGISRSFLVSKEMQNKAWEDGRRRTKLFRGRFTNTERSF